MANVTEHLHVKYLNTNLDERVECAISSYLGKMKQMFDIIEHHLNQTKDGKEFHICIIINIILFILSNTTSTKQKMVKSCTVVLLFFSYP